MKRLVLALLACLLALPAAGDGFARREGVTTNLLLRSQEFDNAAWTVVAGTMGANAVKAPDNTLTADSFTAGVGAGDYAFYQSVTVTSGATMALSLYVRNVDAGYIGLRVTSGADAHAFYAAYNLAAGTVGDSGANGAGVLAATDVEVLSGGWVRLTLAGSIAGNATYFVIAKMLTGSTWNGSNANTTQNGEVMYLWGAQMQTGNRATHYVATGATTATRRAPGRMGTDGFN